MPEQVSTGGLMTFQYKKQQNPELDPEDKKEISGAYDAYYERKKTKSKRKRIIISISIIIALILLGIGIYLLFNK
ncbi:MAG: hypothetical protein Q7S74_05280 [Nanoarchaeota archaeon]|nr:hypothetical protein [Nanoarchaeota archaeon]